VAVRADTPGTLQALVWTDREHAREVLLEQPATCLDPAAATVKIRAGEALFNSPALLGGQAERAGLSCASCHANGRRSQWFRLDGVSGEPGTADVSSSFFSTRRANGQFDPKPIPDLALPGKISHDGASGQLEQFMRGLIVEEFSGGEPSAQSLAVLASYVRAVRACPDRANEPRGLVADLSLVNAGIEGAIELLRQGDRTGASKLVKGARFRLGLISERMNGGGLAGLRRDLLSASRELSALQETPVAKPLQAWQAGFERKLKPALIKAERRSLYAPAKVDRWLKTRP
jgi:hypothetical protein